MTDLEMTRLCAEAMGYRISQRPCSEPAISVFIDVKHQVAFDPIHDDAQAMALFKKFLLAAFTEKDSKSEIVWQVEGPMYADPIAVSANLNRAIVGCVAKMQADKRA